MSKTEQELEIADDAESLRRLLEFIHRSRGFDFTGYKRTSLKRRLAKRMQEAGVESYGDYQDYLEANPHEFAELFNTILINVTSFFRDRAAWTFLTDNVIPQLAEGDGLIRAWCAGCATGEEAYTIAMVLAEVLGEQGFRERVKIYATDVDENALNRARHAVYQRDSVKNVPPELLERYFESTSQGYVFRSDLRRSVIFGRNDLVQDAPISRVDLLVSRNALMYFTAEAQSRILERFNFALSERGFLFLGKSEMLITHTDLFTPYDLKWRVFKKVPRQQLRDRLAFVGGDGEIGSGRDAERYGELRTGAFALALTPQILISRTGFVVDINKRARDLLDLRPSDIGRPFQDLAVSYRPADLRTAIEQAYGTGEQVTIDRVAWPDEGEERRYFEIQVRVVPSTNSVPLGVAMSFHDITALTSLADEHEERKRELETAYEELQSTVEELETTNEELQSTNDELETMNSEQVERSTELDRVNMFLEGILTSLGVGVVVLDGSRRVQVWNGESTELWGLRPEEVEGHKLDELDIGLPVKRVVKLLDVAMGSEQPAGEEVEAVNRRGRKFTCAVRALPLITPSNGVSGALLLMADAQDGGLPHELPAP